MSDGTAILSGMRVILEGGKSDNQRLELSAEEPSLYLERGAERYSQVLDYWDQHMRDITGCWR